jgi:hypothetical protein
MSRISWIPWQQPVLASDTDYGTVSASSINTAGLSYAWKASDGNHEGSATSWESDKYVVPAQWMWKFPVKLRISNILLYNKYSGSTNVTKQVAAYSDEAQKQQIGTTQTFAASSFSTVTITPDTPVETDTLVIVGASSYGTYVGIGEVVITAEAQLVEYEVTFKDSDGTVLKTEWVASGGSATAPEAPTRPGLVFKGWDVAFDKVTGDLIVTAQYRIEGTLLVTFKNYNDTILKTEYVLEGGAATAPDVPQRDGYNFTGWDVPFDNVIADTTVTAQFAAKVYHTVRFLDWNTTELKTQQVEDGFPASAPDPPSRDGYRFLGWDALFSEVHADLDVNALYEKLVYYTATFQNWDGSVLKTESVVKGGAATPPANPARSGYNFAGWNPSAFTNIKADTTFIAQFERIIVYHTVGFYDGGVLLNQQKVEHGTAALTPLPPVKSGYIFDHWDTDFSNITADLTVHSVFRAALDHTVIFIYSASGALLQTVDKVMSATFRDSLDGELTFEFSTLAARGAAVTTGCVAEYDGCYFNVVRVAKSISSGLMVTSVSCEHISYVLNDERYNIENFDFTGAPLDGLSKLLSGTQFGAGSVEFTADVTMKINQSCTRRAALMQYIAILGGEIEYQGSFINIRKHRGSTNAKNLLESLNVTDVSVTYESRADTASYEIAFHKVADCAVGDEVRIVFSPLGVDTNTRIVALEYNPFYRYSIRVEVGDYKPTISDDLYSIEKSAADNNNDMADMQSQFDDFSSDYGDFQSDYDDFLSTYKEVQNLSVSSSSFSVTYTDGTMTTYNYSVDAQGRITSITKAV